MKGVLPKKNTGVALPIGEGSGSGKPSRKKSFDKFFKGMGREVSK